MFLNSTGGGALPAYKFSIFLPSDITAYRVRDRSIIFSIKPQFETDSLLIYVFCTSCEPEIVLPNQNKKLFHIRNLFKTRKSTKNRSPNFGLIEVTMDLSYTLLSVAVDWLCYLAAGNLLEYVAVSLSFNVYN